MSEAARDQGWVEPEAVASIRRQLEEPEHRERPSEVEVESVKDWLARFKRRDRLVVEGRKR